MRSYFLVLLISILFVIPHTLSAEETNDDVVGQISPTIGEVKREIKERVDEETKKMNERIREELKKVNEEKLRMQKQALELKENRDQVLKEMKLKKSSFEAELEKKRREMKEEFESEREEFKEKLEALKSEKKKEVVEKLDANLAAINTRQTNHLSEVLTKLNGILDRFEEILQKAKDNGKDTSPADTAIAEAAAAIEAAQAAVAEQAGKDYVITINTEENLKINVGETNNQLRSDIKSVQQKVLAAKDAVKKVARAMHELRKAGIISVIPTISTSPSTTPIPTMTSAPTETPDPSPTDSAQL